MADYQRKTLVPLADVGTPGPLPADLFGLADDSLADLEAAIGTPAATQLGYLNTGFFPGVAPPPIPPSDVTQVQFRLACNTLGFLANIEAEVPSEGADTQIRWQCQVVLAPTDVWLTDLCMNAGLLQADIDAIFALALSEPDALRTLLVR